MAINIPPDQSGSGPRNATSETKKPTASDAATRDQRVAGAKTEATPESTSKARQESAVVKAIVTEVQARQASGQYTRTVYEATVQLNPSNKQLSAPQISQPQLPKDQIDPTLSRQIQTGRSVAIRVETQAPLKTGQLLDVQLTGDSLKLVKVAPPPIQMTAQPLIRQEMSLQNSYAHLLAKVMAVIQSLKSPLPLQTGSGAQTTQSQNTVPFQDGPIASAPLSTRGQAASREQPTSASNQVPMAAQQQIAKKLGEIVRQFAQSLPTEKEASSAQGLKTAVKNSGIFYEPQILRPDRIAADKSPTDRLLQGNNGQAFQGLNKNNAALNTEGKRSELIQQIRQQIKTLKTTLNDNPANASNNSTTGKPSDNALNNVLARDLKYNLLQLEKQLKRLQNDIQNSQPAKKSPGSPATDQAQIKSQSSDGGAAIKQSDIKTPEPGIKSLDKIILDQVRNKSGKDSPVNPEAAQQRAAEKTTPSHVYQRPSPAAGLTSAVYQDDSGDTSKPKVPGMDWAHPPLPGKINVQPQMIRPNLAPSESLADALISVLIKHTKEATSRLNLHQLASLTDMARPEAAAQQTMLSFELPILQGLDLSLFQFRIYDEETGNSGGDVADKKEKKWVVHMGFDLEGLGPMYCQITLIGVSASVTFWAEEKSTADRSKAYLQGLKENLGNLGVTVKEIQCIKGSPPTDESGIKQTLIDIET